MRRFDAQSLPLLKLLSRGKCLDELLIDEPYKPEWMKKIDFDDPNAVMPPKETLKMTEAKEYLAELDIFLDTKERVQFYNNAHDAYDKLVTNYPACENAFDVAFKSRSPTAYLIPTSSLDTISNAMLAINKKVAELSPDIRAETGIIIFEREPQYGFLYRFEPGTLVVINIDVSKVTGHLHVVGTLYIDLSTWAYEEGMKEMDIGFTYDGEHYGDAMENAGYVTLISLFFIHFFQVEKTIISAPANAKSYSAKKVGDVVYESKLTYPINIIDSSWFTTITRTDPFLVKGHFRKQPYGKGRGQYKMIYISPFQKNGYTRKAKGK